MNPKPFVQIQSHQVRKRVLGSQMTRAQNMTLYGHRSQGANGKYRQQQKCLQ